jgi:hypothetical protein
VLQLPEVHQPGDPRYDTAVLAAYAAACERSTQPVRLLVQVNPWLTRGRLHDQLQRARARGAVTGPDPTAVQQLLAHPGYTYLTTHGSTVGVEQVRLWNLAADDAAAERLLAAARKVHVSA